MFKHSGLQLEDVICRDCEKEDVVGTEEGGKGSNWGKGRNRGKRGAGGKREEEGER